MALEHEDRWLAVIGKSLAYLCLKQAEKEGGVKLSGLLAKVKFLKGLGLSQAEAAEAVGSSAASISELMRQAKQKAVRKGTGNGSAKKRRK